MEKQNEKLSILAVEDNYADFKMIQHTLLEALNFRPELDWDIEHADYLHAAFSFLNSKSFDVVLLDLNLPDENGLRTLSRMTESYPDMPIIVMTGTHDTDLAFDAVSGGAQDYIEKEDFDGNSLVRSIRYAIERKKNATIKLALALEQERVHMLRHLISDVSHDFRTPLSIIGSSIYLYGSTGDVEHLDHISQQVHHMTGMLEDFTQISKLDNEIERLDLRPANIIAFIKDTVSEYTSFAEAKGHKISFSSACSDCMVKMDRRLFYRALSNVLTNAIKYTKDNGRILVNLEHDTDLRYCILSVHDNGIGIRKENLPKIFDRFYRADVSRSSSEHGSGLGLAITKKICEMHNATISIDSQLGVGTVVSIEIPMHESF